jgi:Flp pilus assembly protein CpaB
MRNKKTIILTILAAIIVAVAGYAYYIWNKPARDVADEKGIEITSVAISIHSILMKIRLIRSF